MPDERTYVGGLFTVLGLLVTALLLTSGQNSLIPMGLFLLAAGLIVLLPTYL